MPTIGLTGGFGTGKSTVLKLFKKLGAHTVDSDKLVADILKRPVIINKLIKILGSEVVRKRNGKSILKKSHVAGIIFADPDKRKAVEKIIHPEVLKEIKAVVKKIYSKDKSATIVVEVPLLFETGFYKYFDKTIVVYCKKETAINRLMKKGFSKEEALKRIRAQMPISRKKRLADFLIDNNKEKSGLKMKVKGVGKKIS
ncbi:MAG: dephospho-CoA kinase [Nitrospirae bacterium]|nr:dephospho-CoA kinase [Nitrospirota bacterium]